LVTGYRIAQKEKQRSWPTLTYCPGISLDVNPDRPVSGQTFFMSTINLLKPTGYVTHRQV